MAMYAVGILPLIHQLRATNVKQAWYADDATAGGQLYEVHSWWTELNKFGPSFGYFPNPSKSWLTVKLNHLSTAQALFDGSGVNVITDGKRHLGTSIGSRSFVVGYAQDKDWEWVDLVKKLSTIAKTESHAAYSAFTLGLSSKWTFFLYTIPDIADLWKTPSTFSSFLP